MDYKEEQNGEIEALDSIYYNDFEIVDAIPFHKFRITIKTENFDQDPENGLTCCLVFTYTPKYPEEPPEVEVEDGNTLSDENISELIAHILEQAKDNLGMVMIFTLVSAGQEWLNVKADEIKNEKEEGERRKKKAEEEAEMKRFEGTRVSVESFLAWKTKFESEMGIAAKREKEIKENRKLTGRELFLRDTTLNESDLKFLDDGDAIKVDESLFQDLDDLDLSDDEDDEDYVPGQSDSD